ncbi:MAG TPA: carbonic anhydrase [Thermomicrobiales bacterium]|jgi:carbonic anhydrase|nr:carbonic anhydrase [Thermomicrobiales bacterium]
MSEMEAILRANRAYATEHGTIDVPLRPARKLAVLTCMDSRIQLFPVLGLRLGDAHVIRNAGGRASDDAIRSLMVSTNLLGTREIIVMHHTDCGQHRFTNQDIREHLIEHRGVDLGEGHDFLTFTRLYDSVGEDVAKIRASTLLPPDITVSGLIFDVATGLVHAVDTPTVTDQLLTEIGTPVADADR